jgi:hypothetical protein
MRFCGLTGTAPSSGRGVAHAADTVLVWDPDDRTLIAAKALSLDIAAGAGLVKRLMNVYTLAVSAVSLTLSRRRARVGMRVAAPVSRMCKRAMRRVSAAGRRWARVPSRPNGVRPAALTAL